MLGPRGVPEEREHCCPSSWHLTCSACAAPQLTIVHAPPALPVDEVTAAAASCMVTERVRNLYVRWREEPWSAVPRPQHDGEHPPGHGQATGSKLAPTDMREDIMLGDPCARAA